MKFRGDSNENPTNNNGNPRLIPASAEDLSSDPFQNQSGAILRPWWMFDGPGARRRHRGAEKAINFPRASVVEFLLLLLLFPLPAQEGGPGETPPPAVCLSLMFTSCPRAARCQNPSVRYRNPSPRCRNPSPFYQNLSARYQSPLGVARRVR